MKFFFFFLLGLISVISQAMILREITTLFYGNEMFYGLGLGSWLLFGGLGGLVGIKFKKFFKNFKLVWLVLLISIFLFPLLIIFWRWLTGLVIPPGELPSPLFVFAAIFPPLFLFCFLLGAAFALGGSFWKPNLGYFWETIGFVVGGLFFSFVLATANFSLGLKWRYPNLEKIINSKYQQIMVTKNGSQKSYFIGGQLAFTNQESYETKQILSLITPFVSQPKKILVVGNPNIAREIETFLTPEETLFLEIDKDLGDLEKELLGEVHLVIDDPRRFLNKDQNWDLIIFSLGNPQTLLANRYFTFECFWQIKNRLGNDGIFVLFTYLPTDYQSEEAIHFAGSGYQTLEKAFPFVSLLTADDQLIFLASNFPIKINQQKINPQFKDYFWYQMNNPKRQEILRKISQAQTVINTDDNPLTFFYQQLFWQTIFSFKTPVYLIKLAKIIPFLLLVFLLLLIFKASPDLRLGIKAASSSFILMSLEVLLIFLFQTKIGYLYSQIALIFALVLLGLGIGVMLGENCELRITNCGLLFLGYLPLLFLIQQVVLWPVVGLGIGLVGGMIFANLNKFYLKRFKNPGFIYAFDLFGGFLGAILTASFLLPLFGLGGVLKGLGGIILINLFSISKLQG